MREASGAQDAHELHLHVVRLGIASICKFLIGISRIAQTVKCCPVFFFLTPGHTEHLNELPEHLRWLFPRPLGPPLLHPDKSQQSKKTASCAPKAGRLLLLKIDIYSIYIISSAPRTGVEKNHP